jgi:hypothetical protein
MSGLLFPKVSSTPKFGGKLLGLFFITWQMFELHLQMEYLQDPAEAPEFST